jgi:hypothetical protein
MRNSRRLVGGLVVALVMSTGLSADTGTVRETRDTCVFLQGILYKVGSPAIVGAVFERVFGCDLDW